MAEVMTRPRLRVGNLQGGRRRVITETIARRRRRVEWLQRRLEKVAHAVGASGAAAACASAAGAAAAATAL